MIGDGRRGGGPAAADRISGLSDDLLHGILLRLNSTPEAARTSVLSRRWRHVWAHLPELSLRYHSDPSYPHSCKHAPRAHDRVHGALAAYAGTAIQRLEISIPDGQPDFLAERASLWLRFASRRLAGELWLDLHSRQPDAGDEIVLPVCERATALSFHFSSHALRFRRPCSGGEEFAALASVRILGAHMDSDELGGVLSSRCPSLKELTLRRITLVGDPACLSICSGSLEQLDIEIGREFLGRLEVTAAKLHTLSVSIHCDAHIAAPMLSDVEWYGQYYNSSRHRIAEAGRHLRRLEIWTTSSALMQRFNIVDELSLTVHAPQGVQGYNRFLEDTYTLPKCEVLAMRFSVGEHAFKPAMLRLFRKCAGIKKLVVRSLGSDRIHPCELPICLCSQPESCRTDNIVLDSLEEVEVASNGKALGRKAELVKLLCECSSAFGKTVSITLLEGRRSDYNMCKHICRLHPPNDKVRIIANNCCTAFGCRH